MGERYRNSVGECHYLKESETVFVNAWHSLAWFWQQLWFSSVILFLVPWLSVHGRSPTSPIKHETQEPNRASHSIFMANMIFFSVGHVQSVCQSNLSASQNFGGDTGKRMKVEATFFFFFCLIRTWKHADWGDGASHVVVTNSYNLKGKLKK